MSKITHPNMGGGAQGSVKTDRPKSFIVDDPTIETNELDGFINDSIKINQPVTEIADDYQSPAAEHISDPGAPATELVDDVPQRTDAMKKLESIIFTGKMESTIEVAGSRFELSTLTNRENNNIIRTLMAAGDISDVLSVRVLTLSYVIKKINDVPFGDLVDDSGIASEDQRVSIVDNMQSSVIEHLWAKYEEMLTEHEGLIDGDKIKK